MGGGLNFSIMCAERNTQVLMPVNKIKSIISNKKDNSDKPFIQILRSTLRLNFKDS